MYKILKKITISIVPRKLLFKQEENLRSFYSYFYSGNRYQCNICDIKLKKFITASKNDFLCPNCGSLQRNRRLWHLLKAEFLFADISILDFSPSRCLYRKLKVIENINYQSTDLSGDFIADYQYDITNLKISDNSLDLIICYHILEHITNDILAMKELFRVMKSGAKALIQTPFKEGEIYENFCITNGEDRLKHFGQEDHVRIYSVSGLKERLENSGFNVEIRINLKDENQYCLNKDEKILVLTKP